MQSRILGSGVPEVTKMRLIVLASVFFRLASATTTANSAVGVNWSPFHHPDYDSSSTSSVKAVIEEDFAAIAASGFEMARTFYSRYVEVN